MSPPTGIVRGHKYHQPSSWSEKYDRPRVWTRFRPRVIQHPRERITTSSFSGQNFIPQWWPLVRNVGQLKLQGLGRAIQNCGAHSERPKDQHQDSKQASCCHKREMNICDENEGTVSSSRARSPFGSELINEVTGPKSTADFFLRLDNFMATVKCCNLCKLS